MYFPNALHRIAKQLKISLKNVGGVGDLRKLYVSGIVTQITVVLIGRGR